MNIKVSKITKVEAREGSNLRGYATVVVDDAIMLTGIKIVDGANGLFVSMPAQKGKDEEYHDIFFPVTKEARTELNEMIIDAYNAA